MNDFLDNTFNTSPDTPSLEELVTPPTTSSTPSSAIRNRAATTAILSNDPQKVIENYQLLSKEGGEGQSDIHKQYIKNIIDSSEKTDMHGLMSILSDPTIPFATKKDIVSGAKTSQLLRDSGTILHSNNLASESAGENADQEAARISAADSIREIYDARIQIQGLVNAHGATLEGANIGTAADMAALWVLPFGNSISTAKVSKGVAKLEGAPESFWKTVKNFILPGTATQNMRDRLASLPPEQRVEYAKSLIAGIKANSGIIFSSDNQFAQFDKASSIFEDGGYSDTQEFLDNVSPLLDLIGLGQLMRGPSKSARLSKAGKGVEEVVHPATWELVDDQIKRIETNSIIRKENPSSPANIIQQSNPARARGIHAAVIKSTTDEVAEALHGVDKNQAIINDVMPQIVTESGRVTDKVFDIEKNLRKELQISDELVDLIENTGASYYTKGEKAQARANVVNDFASPGGLTPNDAMSSFIVEGGQIHVGAVYGTNNGAFLHAEDAFQQAKFALRNKGILDEEISVLKKEGLDYVPIDVKDAKGIEGSYLVRITTKHDIDPTDISSFEKFDVKRNLFDRIGPTVTQNTGSVSRYVFDAASMLHPIYTGAASVASDATAKFDKFMLTMASDYSNQYTKLPKARQILIDDYIREANFKGIKPDIVDFVARGFSNDEISALQSWRKFWDGHFYLENSDIVKTLNSQNYQLFRNRNTELYVKPIAKNQNLGRLYDPATDSVISHSKAEGDALYASGGTYAKLRRPADFSGHVTEYMIVRNTPTEYTRAFRSSDQVLNYREGYFQLQYNAPKFVDEIKRDAKGDVISSRTIAVAGDTKEAQFFADRSKATTGNEYRVRSDVRALQRDSDAWWDLNSASGRIAQRHRGKLLEDASGLNHLGDGSYILNPVDSAVRASKSIGGRVVARPMLEAAKSRFINQYRDVLPLDSIGQRTWPRNVKEITAKGADTSKQVADARTTYEYINYLENGYINNIDDVFKWGLNTIADMAGKVGLSKVERAAMWTAEGAPASLVKNSVFMAYIGTNPLRQWIIQPHQILRTLSYNPQGWINGGIEKLSAGYLADKSGTGIAVSAETKAFTKFMDDSGMMDAVDKQNLVRGTLMSAADNSNPVIRNTKKYTTTLTRQIGFDIGEMANLLGHSAAVYEKRTRAGQNLANKSIRDEAYSEIRAISYDMNFAGDMPYNQTSPSMILQFMQVPHKALLQMTNRRIDPSVRLRMVAADIAMWGPPTLLVSALVGNEILPDNPRLREAFVWGLESALLNNMFSILSEEDVNIDFSSLAPYDMTGWGKFFTAMFEGGISSMIDNSPAGQLFLKEGGRVRNAIGSMSRFFGIVDDIDETPETFVNVLEEVAKISSGFSNYTKARILLDAHKRIDQYGNVIDKNVTNIEAYFQLLGFSTVDTRDLYRISKEMSTDVKKHKEEVLKVYDEVKRYYTEKLESDSSDMEFVTKVTGRILKVYENDPAAQAIIAQKLSQDLKGKDAALLSLFMKKVQIPNIGNLIDEVKQMPVDDEQKKLMLQIIDDVQNIRLENKGKK